MKNLMIYIFVLLPNLVHAQDWYDRWSANGSTWYEKWDNTLKQVNQLSQDEKFELLGKAVSAGPSGDNEKKEIFNRAQSALLEIPGHATYYQDKIESLRAEALANEKTSPEDLHMRQLNGEEIVDVSSYMEFCTKAFRILKFLPSPETVSVLGHYLNDPEGRDGKTLTGTKRGASDVIGEPSNAGAAMIALDNLIQKPPISREDADRGMLMGAEPGGIDIWKDWWNEVAAGKRTYRFIGSDVEYGPDGPASREVLERIKRNQKRDEERAAGRNRSSSTEASSVTETPKPWTIGGLIASCLLCAGAVWYLLKGRKAA